MKTQSKLKLATLILFHCLTITMLFAQTPSTPTQPDSSTGTFPEVSAYANTNLTYKIIDAANNTFCYDIYADGRLMIHLGSATGLSGNEGFKTRADAEKVHCL